MPYQEEHDRYCHVCNGTRQIVDVSRDDYSYGAKTVSTCNVCYVPSKPEPIISNDDLIAASIAKMGMTPAEYYEAFPPYWRT